jgi:ADP-L-glycero-D-manno-heptose 6-epimerase
MIVVTGGAGFIGSALIAALNKRKIKDILVVDRLGSDQRWKNLRGLSYADYIDKEDFIEAVRGNSLRWKAKAVFHLGACSDTTEEDASYLVKNNYQYTKHLAQWASNACIQFIYASSAATYGDGSEGFKDDIENIESLRPLNMYGYSKHLFDQWAEKAGLLETIAGLKYFNVFGPNEYHKGSMRSFPLKAYEQINATGKVQLFKSYNQDYADGEQVRDFIYVKDAVDMTLYFLDNPSLTGLFNIGSAVPRNWNDLARATFAAMGKKPNIEYIEMPEAIRNQYQYYTCADITKLRKAGYTRQTAALEESITDYIQNYLQKEAYLSEI